MNYKVTQEVKFKGAKIQLGGPEPIFLSPKEKTYIWEVIERINNKPLYLIQHPEGVEVDFFQQNAPGFGVDNFNKLQKMVEQIGKPIKFAYATADFLEPIAPPEQVIEKPINIPEPTPIATENIDVSEETKQEELRDINEYLDKEADEAAPQSDETIAVVDEETEATAREEAFNGEIKQDKKIQFTPTPEKTTTDTSLSIPHFTFEGLDTSEMDKVSPKPQKLWATQMPVSFSIEKPNGITEIGNKSDYLIATQNGFLAIETAESFKEKYQENKTLVSKAIGSGGEEFLLNPKVAEYLTFLEKENVRVRTEAFLNRKN